MKKLIIITILCLSILPAISYPDVFAVGVSTSLITHFIYPVGHAGFIHWLTNTWSLLVLHNLIKWYRALVAYILSVALSFVLPLDKPVLGLSVLVCFLMGMLVFSQWRRDRLTLFLTLSLLVLTLFLPGVAGIYHIIMFALGALYIKVEFFFRGVNEYIKE